MRAYLRVFLFLWVLQSACAQGFEIQSLRYNDDPRIFRYDTTVSSWYRHLKYTAWGKNNRFWHSLGGEVRLQHQWYRNEDWGEVPSDRHGFVLIRTLLHSDWHWGRNFRIFTQLGGHWERGRADPMKRGIDQNPPDMQQLFADIVFLKKITLRVGRQELLYGSQRLISVREGANVRQRFDATRLLFENGRFRTDIFGGWYVPTLPVGTFNDPLRPHNAQRLWGLYSVLRKIPSWGNIDWYYLGYEHPLRRFDEGLARELRHSVGSRFWGRRQSWIYDLEVVGQWGRFGAGAIRAWTASAHLRYQWSVKWMMGFKTEWISGDRRRGDGQLESFNPLYPRGGYFGLAALIGPSNLFDIHPALHWEPAPGWTLEADYDVFWRMQSDDGIYGPAGQLVRGSRNTQARAIGQQWAIQMAYAFNTRVQCSLEGAFFKTGAYLRNSGAGENLLFGATTLSYKW
jgi:hypothetical protein